MSDPSGWFWVILGVLGVGLGLAIAYARAAWRRRRKTPETQQAKDEATRELYREEERHRNQREKERLHRDWGQPR
jgi:type VI protein secretion system component VasK